MFLVLSFRNQLTRIKKDKIEITSYDFIQVKSKDCTINRIKIFIRDPS